MKTLFKDVLKRIDAGLSAIGFDRCAPSIFQRPLSDGFAGWVGLNHAIRGELLELNPVVGVRSSDIENIVAQQLGENVNLCVPPTISASLGYLLPGESYVAWLFDASTAEMHAAKLLEAIAVYAVPFMESSASLDSIVHLISNNRFSHRESEQYRLPVAYLLLDHRARAIESCRGYLDAIGPRTDPAAIKYRAYSESLIQLVESGR